MCFPLIKRSPHATTTRLQKSDVHSSSDEEYRLPPATQSGSRQRAKILRSLERVSASRAESTTRRETYFLLPTGDLPVGNRDDLYPKASAIEFKLRKDSEIAYTLFVHSPSPCDLPSII